MYRASTAQPLYVWMQRIYMHHLLGLIKSLTMTQFMAIPIQLQLGLEMFQRQVHINFIIYIEFITFILREIVVWYIL
jgi:hypothetical protein